MLSVTTTTTTTSRRIIALCLRSSSSSLLSKCRNQTCRSLATVDLEKFKAVNEPIRDYLPGSADHTRLKERLSHYTSTCSEVPIVIGDEEIKTDSVQYQVMPFDHQKKIAKYHYADQKLIQKAIDSSVAAQRDWERRPYEERAQIFLKASQLMQEKSRMELMATTMLGQAKTIIQAEIDATCELIDFLNFNIQFGYAASRYQPISEGTITNRLSYRGMEGFWASISPFNFTAIGGNLSSGPAIAGNCVVWKPSDTAILSNYTVYKIFREAGLPGGVINFVPAAGPVFGGAVTQSRHLAGINFTGSVATFEHLWKEVGNNLSNYVGFPRMIGECGGKNFHLVDTSADVQSVINGTLRSAFEFGGQKCSACSRLYLPRSISKEIIDGLVTGVKDMKLGSPLEDDTFLSAVIDDKSFARNKGYLDHAKNSADCEILVGGNADDSTGYFVSPTIVVCKNPNDKILREEIFGPVLSVYVYEDGKSAEIIKQIDESTRFALTGAIFAKDEGVIQQWSDALRFSAGNFYVNDKSTGSVVGQQPFGGARKSGTNDKAGGAHYLLRYMSPLAVKSNTAPITEWKYPYMMS